MYFSTFPLQALDILVDHFRCIHLPGVSYWITTTVAIQRHEIPRQLWLPVLSLTCESQSSYLQYSRMPR